ncbi:MAG TPA: TIGR04551 family protein [Polyangiaceae bacterium]|nr:TIGR04551 family protein [Polyangiaceae bacterium]
MRKRSALLVSAFSASLSFAAFAQPAPDAKKPAPAAPDAKKPAPEAKPDAKKPAPAPADAKKPAPATPAEPKPAPAAPAPAPAPAAPAPAAEGTPAEAPAPAPAAEGTELPEAAPEQAGALPAQPGLAPLPVWPEPSDDAAALKRQGAERPGAAKRGPSDAVFAEDWWTHTRPILEWHGAFRARGELFYKFHLGRKDDPSVALFPRSTDHFYTPKVGGGSAVGAALCTPKDNGSGSADGYADAKNYCTDNTNAGANMRFRLDPEFHVSDNLRVVSQIDLLDNMVLGSTPSGYASDNGQVVNRNGYSPLGVLDDGSSAPNSRNSLRDSIIVKRVWAEWTTPVGQLRFGRMPNHWGLGMVYNSGDGHDDDYQSTIDRAQIISGVKSLDLYASAAIDFPNEGPTSDSLSVERGQPYDVAQLDDVNQYTFSVLRKKAPELTRAALTKGDIVINGGLQLVYRHQLLASDATGPCGSTNNGTITPGSAALNCPPSTNTFIRRGAHIWQPDVWFQLLYQGFRFEAEAATVQGSIENVSVQSTTSPADENWKIRSWGFAGEIEQALAENKLHLGFKSGWASGDADVDSLTPGTGVQDQHGDHTISTFRFHPSYALDLILYRNILTRVQGTYYFRPSVKYDFLRDPNGQKIGGGIAATWSRASEFMQTPGHARDLGVELNGELYFQSKDGSLNDDPGHMGGFFAKLQYAVLFPMSGLGYTANEAAALNSAAGKSDYADTNLAQALRLFLGVSF